MIRNAVLVVLALAWCVPTSAGAADAGRGDDGMAPVVIDYFFETGCPACARVRQEVLPALRERYAGFYRLQEWDVGALSNVVRLTAYQEQLGIGADQSVCMVVDYTTALSGFEAIRAHLFAAVDAGVEARLSPGWREPAPIAIPDRNAGVTLAETRVGAFTVLAVLAAGATDGLNPCAIATLVFFMSLLTVAKVGGRGLLLLGIAYCLAAFVTYVSIGVGLMRTVRLFHGFPMLRWGLETTLFGALLVAAWLSFRDAWRFHRRHVAAELALRLPPRVQHMIHGLMRRGVKGRHLVLGGIATGVAVTVLESVCTGQMYLPTLALVIDASERGAIVGKAWALLLLYNAMFILPLVGAFALTYAGLKSSRLLQWSKRHVVVGKVLLGSAFLVMAALAAALTLRGSVPLH